MRRPAKRKARAQTPRRGRVIRKAKRRAVLADPETKDPEGWRRTLHNGLLFPSVCPRRRCKRARACVGDAEACFERWWPVVPEDIKDMIRLVVKARHEGQSPQQAVETAECTLAYWREWEARQAESEAQRAAGIAVKRKLPPQPRIRML